MYTRNLVNSERIRKIIQFYVANNVKLLEKLRKKIEVEKINKFFNYCINCGSRLDYKTRRNHLIHKNIEVFNLKFCCYCYEQFMDYSVDELPAYLLEDIQNKIRAYKEFHLRDSLD
ncbi:MAG: hypothetical protein ACFFBE_09255 [Promethearchaeota archaeon]